MLCKECNEPLPEGRRICRKCGARNFTSSSGEPTPDRSKNCTNCGESLNGRRICPHCGTRHFTPRNSQPVEETPLILCKNCNSPLPEGRRICKTCGTSNFPRTARETTKISEESEKPHRRTSNSPVLEKEDPASKNVSLQKDEPIPKSVSLPIEAPEVALPIQKETTTEIKAAIQKEERETPERKTPPKQSKKRCESCGKEVIGNQTFCVDCDEKMNSPTTFSEKKTDSCPSCGYEMEVGTSVCENCGEIVRNTGSLLTKDVPEYDEKKICPHCSSELLIGKPFCGMCGEKVDGLPLEKVDGLPLGKSTSTSRRNSGDDFSAPTTYQRRERLPPPPPVVQKNPINLKLIASGAAAFFGLMIVVGLLSGDKKEEVTADDWSTSSTSSVPSESPSTSTEEIMVSPDLSTAFTDSPASTTDTLSIPTEEEMIQIYSELVEEYFRGDELQWSMEECTNAGLIGVTPYYDPHWMYVDFLDFDDNGILEMMVSGDGEEQDILGFYTLTKSGQTYEPKLLISKGYNSKLYLTDYFLIVEEPFDSARHLYKIWGDQLQEVEDAFVEYYRGNYGSIPMTDLLTSNNTNSSSTTSSASNLAYYKPILDTIYTAIKSKSDFTTLREQELSDLYEYHDLSTVGYAFADINRDGKYELMIGDLKGNSKYVIALYSMGETGPKLIFNAGERVHYVVCTDGLIAHSGANSAFSTDLFTYELTPYGLILVNDSRVKDFFNLKDEFIPTYKSFSSY